MVWIVELIDIKFCLEDNYYKVLKWFYGQKFTVELLLFYTFLFLFKLPTASIYSSVITIKTILEHYDIIFPSNMLCQLIQQCLPLTHF